MQHVATVVAAIVRWIMAKVRWLKMKLSQPVRLRLLVASVSLLKAAKCSFPHPFSFSFKLSPAWADSFFST